MITSYSNKLIKEIRKLNKKKYRNKKKLFFIEGIRIIEDSFKSNCDIQYIIYSNKLYNTSRGRELINKIKESNIECYEVENNLIKEISDTENPQGIIAVLKMKENSLQELKEENNFIVFLDRIQDPGNMGTIIRSADALGVDGIIINKGCVDIYNPKVLRATMGSVFNIPIIYSEDGTKTLLEFKNKGTNIFVTSLDSAEYCYDTDFEKDNILVIGNEGNGVSQEILDLSDKNIKIPIKGKAESLNAAIASSIIMYEGLRQRRNI